MIEQSSVAAHANRINLLMDAFGVELFNSVEEIVSSVSIFVGSLGTTKNNVLKRNPRNMSHILEVESYFLKAVKNSNLYPNIMAVVSRFSDQIAEFKQLYSLMGDYLPDVDIPEEQVDMLSTQVVASLIAIESEVRQVGIRLNRFLSKSLGGVHIDQLTSGVSGIIRKLNDIKQITKDQLLLFFRSVCRTFYEIVEKKIGPIQLHYVGTVSDKSRKFCKDLVEGKKTYLLHEIVSMDNDQTASAFEAGGGFGCMHWWSIA